MQAITSAILAAFALYIGAWYTGMVEGNFALLLFLASLVTGVYWLAERFYFLPQRKAAAAALEANDAKRRSELQNLGISQVDGDIAEAKVRLLMQMRPLLLRLVWLAALLSVFVVIWS